MLVEIFKAGTYKFGEKTYNFSVRFLKRVVSLYNKRVKKDDSKAPFVKGHPESDSPAHGWVESLKMSGDKMVADIQDLSSEIMKDISEKKYRNVSISMMGDKLRHVGLLGGATPRVKGLTAVTFDDGAAAGGKTDEIMIFNNDGERIEELEKENEELKIEVNESRLLKFTELQAAKILEFKIVEAEADVINDVTKSIYTSGGYEAAEAVLLSMCELAGKKKGVLKNMEFSEQGSGGTDREKQHKRILDYCEENECGYEVGRVALSESE